MNYEKLYKEALSRARDLHDNHPLGQPQTWMTCERILPELKESEDEKIRKRLIEFIFCNPGAIEDLDEERALAWLEKQSTPQVRTGIEWVNIIDDACDKRYAEEYTHGGYCHEQSFKWGFQEGVEWLEKQGEQKPTDKVEPKFKVGDWILIDRPCRIELIDDNGDYVIQYYDSGTKSVFSKKFCETHFHLWTIQDAKDGDVLATKKGNPFIYDKNRYNNRLAYYYAGLDVNKELTLKSPHNMLAHFGELCSIFPATKEQRDILFQKIHEAGYEWDAEKKELRKIEQKPDYCHHEVDLSNCSEEYRKAYYDGWNNCNQQHEQLKAEQKPAWSEEDEDVIKHLLSICSGAKNYNQFAGCSQNDITKYQTWLKSLKTQLKQGWSEEDEEMRLDTIKAFQLAYPYATEEENPRKRNIDWLKSLKPNHWKPSEYDISLLEEIARNIRNNVRPFCSEVSSLEDLIKNLKTL